MRGDVVYRVYGVHEGRECDTYFGAWKVQYLDLRRVREGVIARDERFGYVPLATRGWEPPWLDLARSIDAPRTRPPPFIRAWREAAAWRVAFDVRLEFDVASGRIDEPSRRALLGEGRGDDDDRDEE